MGDESVVDSVNSDDSVDIQSFSQPMSLQKPNILLVGFPIFMIIGPIILLYWENIRD